MRKILILITLAICFCLHGYTQEITTPIAGTSPTGAARVLGKLYIDSLEYLPLLSDTPHIGSFLRPKRGGAEVAVNKSFGTKDSITFWFYTGTKFDRVVTDSTNKGGGSIVLDSTLAGDDTGTFRHNHVIKLNGVSLPAMSGTGYLFLNSGNLSWGTISIPTLDEVLTSGNFTTQTAILNAVIMGDFSTSFQSGDLRIKNPSTTGVVNFQADNITASRSVTLEAPNIASSAKTIAISIDGIFADNSGNISINIPSIDSGTYKTVYQARQDSLALITQIENIPIPGLQSVLTSNSNLTSFNEIQSNGNGFEFENPNGFTAFGDPDQAGNSTQISINDNSGSSITLSTLNTTIGLTEAGGISGSSPEIQIANSVGIVAIATDTLQLMGNSYQTSATSELLVIRPGTGGRVDTLGIPVINDSINDYLTNNQYKPSKFYNFDLANWNDTKFNQENKSIVTLPNGVDSIHGFIMADGYLWGTTKRLYGTNYLIRINPTNLTDTISIPLLQPSGTITGVSNFWGNAQITYVKSKDRLYIDCTNYLNDTIRIIEANPNTLSIKFVIQKPQYITTPTTNYNKAGQTTSATDGTYLYVLSGYYDPYIYKFELNTYHCIDSVRIMYKGYGHGLMFDGANLYASCGPANVSVPVDWFAKLSTTPMALLNIYTTSDQTQAYTDDMCSMGEFVYTALENKGSIRRFKKSDLSFIDIPLGNGNIVSVTTDGTYVYASSAYEPGTGTSADSCIYRIDPSTLSVSRHRFSTGESEPNEIISDGKSLYFTYYLSPAVVSNYTNMNFPDTTYINTNIKFNTNLSANNFSGTSTGTNTGDQDLSPYTLLTKTKSDSIALVNLIFGSITPTSISTNWVNYLPQTSTVIVGHGNTIYDSSGIIIKDSLNKELRLSRILQSANTLLTDSIPNESGIFVMRRDSTTIFATPTSVSTAIAAITGYLKTNGTTPLTANWNVGSFNVTALTLGIGTAGTLSSTGTTAGNVTLTTNTSGGTYLFNNNGTNNHVIFNSSSLSGNTTTFTWGITGGTPLISVNGTVSSPNTGNALLNFTGGEIVSASAGSNVLNLSTLTSNWNDGTFSIQNTQTTSTANTIINAYELLNTTTASSTNQMYSGAIHYAGQGWKTTATAASQTVDFREYLVPVQGTTAPSGLLTWDAQVAGGGYSTVMTLSNNGAIGFGNPGLSQSMFTSGFGGPTNNSVTIQTNSSGGGVQFTQLGGGASIHTLEFSVSGATVLPSGIAVVSVNGITATSTAGTLLINLLPGRTAVADINYTVLTTDNVIAYTSLTAARTVTLLAAPTTNQVIVIKDEAGTALTNHITVTVAGGVKTIDGSTTASIVGNYAFLKLYYNGTNYFSIQ